MSPTEKIITKEGPLIKLNVAIHDREARMPLEQYLTLLEHLQHLQDGLDNAHRELLKHGGKKSKEQAWGFPFLHLLQTPEND